MQLTNRLFFIVIRDTSDEGVRLFIKSKQDYLWLKLSGRPGGAFVFAFTKLYFTKLDRYKSRPAVYCESLNEKKMHDGYLICGFLVSVGITREKCVSVPALAVAAIA